MESKLSDIVLNKRASLGMSRAELSKKSGVSKMTLSNIERGKQKEMSFKTAEKIADALGVNRIVFVIETGLLTP